MGQVNVDKDSLLIALKQLEQYESDIEAARAALNKKYQLLGSNWNDRKYQELGDIVSECNSALRTVQKSALLGEQSIAALIKVIQAYEDTNIRNSDSPSGNLSMASQAYEDNNADGEETSEGRPLTRHLSADEVNNLWMARVKDTDAMIENYREALLDRGVPEGEWLERTLSEQRSRILNQEGQTLDAASGGVSSSDKASNIYQYHSDYPAVYDELATEFRNFCLEGTNPNYADGPQWQDNCQRCVPTYEMRRRGSVSSAYPSNHGSEHLAYHPFDVWENPQIISTSGNGQADIERAMSSWGDGARAQIVVVWDDGFGINGHTFIAEQRDGTTHYLDPQTNDNDVSSYFEDVLAGTTQFCRIDDQNTTSYINDCFGRQVS